MKMLLLSYINRISEILFRSSSLNSIYSLQINLFNTLISGNKTSDIFISTVDLPPKMLRLERTTEGKLCFTSPHENVRNFPPVFVVTLPKSGTYLIEKILTTLKFQNAGFQADGDLSDTRPKSLQNSNSKQALFYKLPANVQVSLVQPGQFVVGHIPISWQMELSNQIKFCCVRDLRYSIVSFMRYFQAKQTFKNEAWSNLGYTEEALYKLMRSKVVHLMLNKCKEIFQWIELYPETVLRFEDLTSADFANSLSVQNISNILQLNTHEIIEAVQSSRNQKTLTFSGKNSSIDEIWSERVQREFAKLGGVKLNEKMGYK